MKKIGILTINDNDNYGNRLQNYAMQEILRSLGFSVETIVNNTKFIPTDSLRDKVKHSIIDLKGKSIMDIYKRLNHILWLYLHTDKIENSKNKRIKAFKKFTASYICETQFSISDGKVPKDLTSKYDFFITGSDQVWNPFYRHGSPIDFLTFAPLNKRIAYAPSFGISEIPGEFVKNYSTWLSEITRLSVREQAGAEIIKNLTGRIAPVLVDPTMVLTKEKWLSISKRPFNKPTQKYLLTYFLGDTTSKNRQRVMKLARRYSLEIVNLANIKNEMYGLDPSEFIDLINSASVFFTDSYHGVIFSILMQTPFVIFEREGNIPSMGSRIQTLLIKFKLLSRLSKNIKNDDEIFKVNYSHIDSLLQNEREKALSYLKEALQVGKDS